MGITGYIQCNLSQKQQDLGIVPHTSDPSTQETKASDPL